MPDRVISVPQAAQIAQRIKNKFDNVNGRLGDLENNFPVVTGKQLIDKAKAVTGFVTNSGNVETTGSYASYLTSAYVPVEAGKTYTLYRAGTVGAISDTTRMVYCLFDSNKSVVSYFNNTVASVEITPAADGYLRVSMSTNGFMAQAMLIEGTTLGAYEGYTSETFLSDDVNPINSKAAEYINNATSAAASNILNGKKWVHCGDSFSAYTDAVFDDGVFVGKTKVFARLIGLRNGMVINDGFMKSGKTMAYPADGTFTNSLTCPTDAGYFQNIPSDADYITIMLGINDLNHKNGSGTTPDGEDATGVITLGTIDDITTETYCGAYNTVLGWLRENRPFAHVGIVVTNGTQRQDYTEAQIAIAKKWGYPYINLNGDERTPAFIRCYNPNIPTALKDSLKTIQGVDAPSNTHPNWQTHELESTIIEAWLRTL